MNLRPAGIVPNVTSMLKPTFRIVPAWGWFPDPTKAMVTPATNIRVETPKYSF